MPSAIHPQELLGQVLHALEQRGLDVRELDDVLAGCVSQVGEQGANVARNAVLAAGWPIEVGAATLNRFCASGLQAIHFGAMGVGSGAMDLVVAGGVESMSRIPMGSDGAGQDGGNEQLRRRVQQVPQGISADLIATREGYSREEIDAVALRSQERAARAIEDRRFTRSLVPVRDPISGAVVLDRDEHPRPDTTQAGLAALPPSFVTLGATTLGPDGATLDQVALAAHPGAAIRHLHTAGNSSGLADGASRALDLDPDRVNVNGGAIALGHPLGATGAMLLGTALDELERTDQATALITMCIGGGQGIATIVERV